MKEKEHNTEGHNWYKFLKGLIYFKDKLFIPYLMNLRKTLFHEYHNTQTAGHYGIKPAVARLAVPFL